MNRQTKRIIEALNREFMSTELWEGTLTEWTRKGETFRQEESPGDGWEKVEDQTGIWSRLSASGYMDCTEWGGPFASEDEAYQYLADTYGDGIELEPEEPEPEDYIISSNGFRYSVGICEGKHLGEVVEWSDAERIVRDHQRGSNFFPNVWSISDHGNASIVEGWNWEAQS